MTTEISTHDLAPTTHSALSDAWLDAVFAAAREVVIRRVTLRAFGRPTRRTVLVLTGRDIAQLRWMLRLRAPSEPREHTQQWSIELRNTRTRIASLRVSDARFVRADDDAEGWGEIRDGETLARWLDVRGFRAPFEAWKNDRGCVRSRG